MGCITTTTKTGPQFSALFLYLRFGTKMMKPFLTFLGVLLLAACSAEESSWKLSGPTMGTRYHITVVAAPAEVSRESLKADIDAELVAVNQEMSTYIPDSELMRANDVAVGDAVALSDNLALIVGLSKTIYQQSSGAFDVTVGPLVNLWGFGPDPEPETVPSDEEINKLRAQVGSDALTLSGNTLTKSRDVFIDLSAIAKGHGVDRVAELLESKGITNYLVEVGGELRTLGHNATGAPWRIGIERPSAGQVVQKPIAVSGKSIATSGDYRNYYERDGKRFTHTIDPRTGYPVEHRLASVTVIADTCAEADGLATAINVMGAEAGLKLAEKDNLAVFMLVKTDDGFEEQSSTAFSPYLESQGR